MRRFSFGSLRTRLILLVLLAVIPAMGLALYSGMEQRKNALSRALDNALRMAENVSDVQERLIENTRQIFFALSQLPEIQNLNPAGCSKILKNIQSQSKGYTMFFAVRPNGDLFASALPVSGHMTFTDRAWYQQVLKTREFVISEYVIGRLSGKAAVTLAYPVLNRKGEMKAILGTGLDLGWLNQFMAESKLPAGTTLTVIDRKGTILLRYPEPEKFTGKTMPEGSILKAILAKEEGVSEAIGLDGIPRLYGFTSLDRFARSVYVSVGIPKEIAFAEVNQDMIRNLMWLGIVAVLAVGATWVAGSLLIMRPVNGLLGVTERLGEGDLIARTGPRYERGELGQLGKAFDQMAESFQKREAERNAAEDELKRHRDHLEELVQGRTVELKRTNERLEKEITERKGAEERYRAILRTTMDGFWIVDMEGRFLDANDAYCRLIGYNRDELLTMSIPDVEAVERPAETTHRIQKIMEVGGDRFETRHRCKDGSIVDIEVSVNYMEVGGRQMFVFLRDITERKQAEEALRLANAYNRSLIEASLDPLVTIGSDGRVTDVNVATEKVTGHSREELIGTDFMDYFSEPDKAKAGYQQVFQDGFVQDYALEIWHKDGHLTPVLYNASIYRDEAGQVIGVFAAARDITERKRAEKELFIRNKISNIFLTATTDEEIYSEVLNVVLEVMESKYGVVGYIDEDGAFIVPSMSRHIWDKCQVPEKTFIFPRDKWGDSSWPRAIREKKTNYTNEVSILTPEGHINITRHISMPIIFQGEAIGLIQVANKQTDYTEKDVQLLESLGNTIIAPTLHVKLQKNKEELSRKRAEEEIRKLNADLELRVRNRTAQLEAANKELEAFSYSVSHDLRAPLRAIDGFSRIILEDYLDKLDDEGRRVLNVIRGNTQRMAQLIDDLLVFSHLGRQEIRISDVDMEKLAKNAFKELNLIIPERKIHFSIKPLSPIQGDQAMIRQVLINLLSNAVKFTRPKENATIEVGGGREGNENIYYVKDNGVGFDMQYVDKLFGVFQRLHSSEEFEGTGVGLAIVQRIIHRHGGRVWAEGKVGEGASFYFSLPAK